MCSLTLFRNFGMAAAAGMLAISGSLMAQQPMPYGQPQPYGQPYPSSPYRTAPYPGNGYPGNGYQGNGYAGNGYQANPYPQQYSQDDQGYGVPDPPDQPSYPQQYSDNGYGQAPGYGNQYGQPAAPVQAMTTVELEQLVAPVALYPDSLVAQVLAASTYPAQVADAARWTQSMGNAPPDQIVYGADQQNWDPSVKALTAFPQVLGQMAENIRWTVALGNAYYNQPQDVMDTIQLMRQRAEQAGNLQNTPQEAMTYDQGMIQLAPVNPEVVYVPAYDPWTAYGAPIQPYPGFSFFGALGSFLNSGVLHYGLNFALSAFTHTPWGALGWGLDWLTHSLLFNHSSYYSHSTSVRDWGLPRGGPRAGPGGSRFYAGSRMPGRDYRSASGYDRPGYSRPAVASNAYRQGGGYNRAPGYGENYRYGSGFAQSNRLPENRAMSMQPRGYGSPQMGSVRPPMDAYNRAPQMGVRPEQSRPETYARPGGYGSGFYGRGSYGTNSQVWASRPSPAFTNPGQGYRGPSSGYQRAESGSYSGYANGRGFGGYSEKPQKSGGFHLFGGGGHEYKAPKAPKMSSHGGGGGHSGGHGGGGGHGGHHR